MQVGISSAVGVSNFRPYGDSGELDASKDSDRDQVLTSERAFIDNATLQYELASAKTRVDLLAAELLREQEKIKANDNARLFVQQQQLAEKEAALAATVQAETASKLTRDRAQRRRITQTLNTASRMLDLGRLDAAESALDDVASLESENSRLIQLQARMRTAYQMARAPVSDQEFDSVVSRFDELRRAIQSKDLEKINQITVASSQNDLFEQLMSRFARLELSIDAINLNNAEKSITATLRIERMVRNNGDSSIPSSAYRERRLSSRRIGREWSSIQW